MKQINTLTMIQVLWAAGCPERVRIKGQILR